jgi:iron complex outermembrane recepter protein
MVLKRNMLSLALMSATMLLATAAQAQSQQEEETRDKASEEQAKEDAVEELDRVTVTGLRSSIENSIETKRDNSQIVESVSAEDIGQLPDQSIADALARLPGLTAQRERGRATQVQIRGFAGDFSTTLLNGREQASTNDNRAAEFDQYPSELLSQVVVYKTADASLVGQGLSGTVDLQTVNPLSFDERVIAFGYRYDQNESNGVSESGNRFNFSYIDQFLDNTLGISLGYAYQESPQLGFESQTKNYQNLGPNYYPGEAFVFKNDDKFERNGFTGSIQFKPNDFYETSLDAFYSTFDKTQTRTGVQACTTESWCSGGNPGTLNPVFTASNGLITKGSFSNIRPVIRNDSNPVENTTQSYGWNNIFTFNENWKMIVDLSTSKAESEFQFLETYAGVKGNNGFTTLDFALNGDHYDYTYGVDLSNPANLELIDAGGWGQDGYNKNFAVEDELSAYRLDFIRTFADGAISSLEFGFNYTDRSKTKSSNETFLCINPLPGQCGNRNGVAPYPTGTSQVFDFGGIGTLASYSAEQLYNSGFYATPPNAYPDINAKNWEVDEKVSTFYTQFNIDADLGSVRLTGNLGVQYVYVDQSSTGYAVFPGAPAGTTPTTDGATYGNFLPSLNLNFNVFEDQYLRVAMAQQMARPRLDQMRAGYEASINTGTCAGLPGPVWCGGGGNAQLRPWLANAFDVSYEWYFTTENDNKGYLSAALFYKDLQSYVYNADFLYNYVDAPPPTVGQTPGVNYPSSTIGSINRPFNGEGGYMKGYELTASLPLDALWSPLNGFGILATYSSNSSDIEPFPGANQPIPGLSEEIYNASLYWERFGWQVRYNYRYRSEFRGETRGFGGNLEVININAETVQDAQIQYTFSSGFAENLSLFLQFNNLGDEPFTTSNNGRPESFFEYGRQTLIGFNYRF